MAKKKSDPPTEPGNANPQPLRSEFVHAIQENLRALGQLAAGAEPLLDKLTSQHLSDVIANTNNDSQRRSQERLLQMQQEQADRRENRIFWGVVIGLGLLAFVGLWIASLAYGKPDLVLELIKWLGGLLGGLVGGYGLRGAGSKAAGRRRTHSDPRTPPLTEQRASADA